MVCSPFGETDLKMNPGDMNVMPAGRLFVLVLFITATAAAQDPGRIAGIVVKAETEEVVEAVIVLVRAHDQEAFTGPDGTFAFENVPSGSYTMVFSRDGFLTRIRDGVTVRSNETTDLRILLDPIPRPEDIGRLEDITELVGPTDVTIGQTATFRIRVKSQTYRPLEYHWEFGNGNYAAGNPVVHRFDRAGFYEIVVRSRNRFGWHYDTLYVTVMGGILGDEAEAVVDETAPSNGSSQASARPATSRSPTTTRTRRTRGTRSRPGLGGGLVFDWKEGGYAWMVETHWSKNTADNKVRALRLKGIRSGVYADVDASGKMSTVYRVIAGQFSSEEHAMQSKGWLLDHVGTPLILMEIPAGEAS